MMHLLCRVQSEKHSVSLVDIIAYRDKTKEKLQLIYVSNDEINIFQIIAAFMQHCIAKTQRLLYTNKMR